jgi:hypothetical protein
MSSSSSGERGRRRWGRARLPIALAAVALVAALVPAEARQAVTDPLALTVQGAPLGDVVTSGLALTPAFSPTTTDYVLRCRPGINTVGMTLAGAGGTSIRVGSLSGSRVSSSIQLVENQALVVEAPSPTGAATTVYWIRCLPSDFPALSVQKPGTPPPGWYLTGNVSSANGSGTYAMILDSNGTPVWYQKTAGQGAIDVTPVAKNVAAWSSNPGPGFGIDPNAWFSVYDLTSRRTRPLRTRTRPLDFHELLPIPNGRYLLLATPLRPAMDLRALGLGRNKTIVDCLVEEVTAAGRLVWTWRASDHISVAEVSHAFQWTVDRQPAYDVFHCNSIDREAAGDLLLSVRHTDAVYRIDGQSGRIVWKLGGNGTLGDHERHLKIRRDSENGFAGQHDARFEPHGGVSLYDNRTWGAGGARAIEYHVDARADTASLVWQYASPDGRHSAGTGSFRRYAAGSDNLITWGLGMPTLFTEVGANGKLLMDAAFPDGEIAYRVVKAPPGTFDVDLLHRTAGLPSAAFPQPPRVFALGPAHGPPTGGTQVTITGTGFTGATGVRFGAANAQTFTVVSDSSVVAVAPPGSGRTAVMVTTRRGGSATNANILSRSDADFSTGAGSWRPYVNASLALTGATRRSRPYALEVRPRLRGFSSAITSRYEMPGSSPLTGSVWVAMSRGKARVRSALICYDQRGSVRSLVTGRFASVSAEWTRVSVSGTCLSGAASVAIAVDSVGASAALYLDDASLRGVGRFLYQRSLPSVSSISPDNGTLRGGTTVEISGLRLAGATAVRFGSTSARSFRVVNGDTITAVSPSGSGTVPVRVVTPAGTSSLSAPNLLSATDSTFEDGSGSWRSNVAAEVTGGAFVRTGTGSLKIRPNAAGFDSAISGLYSVRPGVEYIARMWAAAPGATEHVRSFVIFYGPAGEILSVQQGPEFLETAPSSWIQIGLSARCPDGAITAAIGVDDADGRADLYVDDVSLTGSIRFTYR